MSGDGEGSKWLNEVSWGPRMKVAVTDGGSGRAEGECQTAREERGSKKRKRKRKRKRKQPYYGFLWIEDGGQSVRQGRRGECGIRKGGRRSRACRE